MSDHRVPRALLAGLALVAVEGCRLPSDASAAAEERIQQYVPVLLTTDLSLLSQREREMLPLLIRAADRMDAIFWKQAWGDRDSLLEGIDDPATSRLAEMNYGPWDRLDGDRPFVEGVGPKPPGANFYPADLTREELEEWIREHPEDAEAFRSLYTVIRRAPDGSLVARPYREEYAEDLAEAARLLEQAAELAEDPGLETYLTLRARALRTDDYRESDLAWLDMKSNRIDIVVGPIETYEDALMGSKAAAEAYVLVKDLEWSRKLERYASMLPELQASLPVEEAYRRESPGTDSDLNAYDVIYYAGDCNAGSKTIAINLPNDEEVQLRKGTRRLQLKNAMRAKFDRILLPIVDILIDPGQRRHVTFDAFFANTMFHEVAHGLGIKHLVDGSGRTVREALGADASAIEEGKADILGLLLVTRLLEKGVLTEGRAIDHYVTFLAGIFRSIRFGASSAHGRANLQRFNFFRDRGAFQRDGTTGTYRVVEERMRAAVTELSGRLLRLQGDGDVAGVRALMEEFGSIGRVLRSDLDRLSGAGIPVDVRFLQGLDVLRLPPDPEAGAGAGVGPTGR